MNVERLADKLEGLLTEAADGGLTTCDRPDLHPNEILFILSMLGRSREQVTARVFAEE